MARSVNQVILIGRVSGSPEVERNRDSMSCRMTIVSNETYQNREGEEVNRKERHCVVVRGSLAEDYAELLTEGTRVWVNGAIETREELESGERDKVEVSADDLQVLGQERSSEFKPSADPIPDRVSDYFTREHGSPVDSKKDSGENASAERGKDVPTASDTGASGSSTDTPSSEGNDSSSSTSREYSSPFPPPRTR